MSELYLTIKLTKMSNFEENDVKWYADRVADFIASGFPVESAVCVKCDLQSVENYKTKIFCERREKDAVERL